MTAMCQCLALQYAKPTGWVGAIVGGVMARRPANGVRAKKTLELLDLQDDHAVLEIGFGPGVAVQRALALVTRGMVAGVDPSAVMLRQAIRRNHRSVGEGRLDLRLGSVETLPNFGRSFDRILAINSIGFWGEPVACLGKLRESLSTGGRLAITLQPHGRNASRGSVKRMADRLARWLDRAGLEQIQREVLDLKPVPAACVIGAR